MSNINSTKNDKNHEFWCRHHVDSKICVDIMSTWNFMFFVVFCRLYVDPMSILVKLMSILVDDIWSTKIDIRSTYNRQIIHILSIDVNFFWRHENDINFDDDFMSTTHNFFFWKIFSFFTHVVKVWILRKI